MWSNFSLALTTLLLVLFAAFIWALAVFVSGSSVPLDQVNMHLAVRNMMFCLAAFGSFWVTSLLPVRRPIVIKLMLGTGLLFLGAWQELLNGLVDNDWAPVRWLDIFGLPAGTAAIAWGLYELGKAYRLNRLLLGSYRKIEHSLATVDQLTQLYNRRYFFATCPELLVSAQTHGETPVIISLRLANLKEINDELGYQAGDNLLTQAGKQVLKHIRSGDIAARLSGRRFAIFLSNITAKDAEEIVQRILHQLEHLVVRDKASAEVLIHPRLDVGICHLQQDEDFEAWIRRAKSTLGS